ncbi:MAG: CotH kinase family protein [Bacteroidetes bacterium]|nr:CotH kinase family protein [Bacteroidota bacterium]
MKNILISVLFSLTGLFIFSQPVFPVPGPLYDDNVVPRIDILIHPDSLDLIYEYPESDHEYPATFIFDNGNIRDTVEEIGFRLRGNTSRWAEKKSFKVAINSFHSGRKYYGVEKINLNGEHNDPSVVRSKLCWDILRSFNIPAPRSNHVRVYINGDYYGLYINVEHIDEEFVLSRFMNNNGNLYKCLWPADLAYLGSDPDLYKLESGDRRVYELKINESEDDYSDLAHFIDVLNNTPIQDLPCELEKVFNVYDYLKVIAVDVTIGNWDGFIYNKNNFYLYHNTASGRFDYIPYDLDNTIGIDWFGVNWEERNMYAWSHPEEPRPLYERILQVEKYRDQYTYYTNLLLEEIVEESQFFPHINALRDQAYPYILDDPYYPLDYAYTPSDFLNSYDQPIGAHVVSGLKPFIESRRNASLSQAVNNNIYPVLNYAWHTPSIIGQDIWFRVFVDEDQPGVEVMLLLSEDGGPITELEMFDDGLHHDLEAGDWFYGCSAGLFTEPVQLEVNIRASDIQAQESYYYCIPEVIHVCQFEIPQLFINEFMASNETTIADEWGDFDDWIEIYNGDTLPVWLGNLYLTDNLLIEDKWQMPDYTLAPDSYILIWADNEEGQGQFHANFKLDKDGEEIGIFGPQTMGYPMIDSIVFGLQQEDVSMGRISDAADTWKFFDFPTPGYNNESGASIAEQGLLLPLLFYPNPCKNGMLYLGSKESIYIFDISGRHCLSAEHTESVDVAALRPGIYIIMAKGHRAARLIIM